MYLVVAPHLSVWPFCRHSIVNQPYQPPSRIYPKFVTLQGQNLQIIECHPRSVGPPSCQEHRPDQNLHFQFLSSIASKPILELRWIVVGLKHSLVAHHLLWKNSGFYSILPWHFVTTTLHVLEPLVLVELPTMLANVRGQMPLTILNLKCTLWFQLRQLYPVEGSLSTNVLPILCWSKAMLFFRLFRL